MRRLSGGRRTMRKINDNDHDLEGDEGEIITVQLNSTGAPPLVSLELTGATWSEGPTAAGGKFTLKDNQQHRVGLDLLFTFEAPTSDVYHVIITGSKGGPP